MNPKVNVSFRRNMCCLIVARQVYSDCIYTYLANGEPFKLLGITYLIGKIKFKLYFQGPLAM